MKINRAPILLSGLILGLLGTGNLLSDHHVFFFHFFSSLGIILWLCLLTSLVLFWKDYLVEIQKPPILSAFATFPMVTMLLAAYLLKLNSQLALISRLLWYAALFFHIFLILYFTWKYVLKAKTWFVTPSWTVLYVGISVAGLTNGVVEQPLLGYSTIIFGLIASGLLYPLLFKKLSYQPLPDFLRPQLAIFCAPFSLILASYIRLAGIGANALLLILLLLISQLFYLLVLVLLPKIFKLGFQPSLSALTFPLVNTALALKLALVSLGWDRLFNWLVHLETILASLVVLYVLVFYARLFFSKKIVNREIQKSR